MTTSAQLYEQGLAFLQAAGIDDPQLESAFFLCDLLGITYAQLFITVHEVTEVDAQRFQNWLQRRARHEPFAYIVGHQEFWGLDFKVTPAVLIPRPETELLVEELLNLVGPSRDFAGTILDLGTGSAVLPVALSHELPKAHFVAVDVSPAALAVARHNVHSHGVDQRVALLAADFLTSFNGRAGFDFIVSNPPYVKRATFAGLQPEVVDHEPHLALDGGGDAGLDAIASFAPSLATFLQPGGWFLMEIGFDQKEDVLEFFGTFTSFDSLSVLDDYAGLPRLLKARRCR